MTLNVQNKNSRTSRLIENVIQNQYVKYITCPFDIIIQVTIYSKEVGTFFFYYGIV